MDSRVKCMYLVSTFTSGNHWVGKNALNYPKKTEDRIVFIQASKQNMAKAFCFSSSNTERGHITSDYIVFR